MALRDITPELEVDGYYIDSAYFMTAASPVVLVYPKGEKPEDGLLIPGDVRDALALFRSFTRRLQNYVEKSRG